VRQLANDFKEERVSEKERFKYLLAASIVYSLSLCDPVPSIVYSPPLRDPVPQTDAAMIDPILGLIGLLVTIVGITVCYRANARGDNRDFIARFICLCWPLGWQMAVVFLVGAIPLIILLWVVAGPPTGTMSWSWEAVLGGFGFLVVIGYYIRLRSYMSSVANSDGGTSRSIGADSVSDAGTLTEIS
jgi:hypothetical protein